MNIKAKRTICLACCTAVVLGGCRGVSDSSALTGQSEAETRKTTAAGTTLASESTSAIGAIVDLDSKIISLAYMYNKKRLRLRQGVLLQGRFEVYSSVQLYI